MQSNTSKNTRKIWQLRKWLKVFHLLFASMWIGGTATLTVLLCLYHPLSANAYEAKNTLLRLIDIFIVSFGAVGCFLTGLVYSIKYKYGFIRFKWITIKWIICTVYVFFGFAIAIPLFDELYQAITIMGYAPVDHTYSLLMGFHLIVNIVQWLAIILLMYLSVFKPVGNKQHN